MTDHDAIRAAMLEHAGQVYDATAAVHDTLRLQAGQPAAGLTRWADLTKQQRQRFARDTAEAMGDVHAATLTIGHE